MQEATVVKERVVRMRKGKNMKAFIDFISFISLLIFYSCTFTRAPIDNVENLKLSHMEIIS